MEPMDTNYARGGEVILAAALILMVILGLSGCDARGESAARSAPPAVDVAEVQPTPVTVWGDYTGRVAAPQTVSLRPRVSGYIDRVAFKEGETVQQGDVLFEIDPRAYQARERAAAADLAGARSGLKLASSEAQRADRLVKSHAISREEDDQRQSALASARARVSAARAALDSARLDLSYTKVRSPITGRAGRAMITRGNLAAADRTVLTTVVSMDPVYVYFDSDDSDKSGALHDRAFFDNGLGPVVRIGLTGETGLPHQGRVDFVDNRLNANTGTLEYRAVLANPEGLFKPGQFARVRMPVAHDANALVVDRKAVLTDQDRRYVYVVGKDNKVARRDISPGRNVDGLLVVRKGLKAGDRVIVNGLQKVFGAGVRVSPQLVRMETPEPLPEVASAP